MLQLENPHISKCVAMPAEQVQDILHKTNAYVVGLRSAMELLPPEPNDIKIVFRARRRPANDHERRFNLPESGEVALLLPKEPHGKRDIVLHRR